MLEKKLGHLTKKFRDISTGKSSQKTDHMLSFQGDCCCFRPCDDGDVTQCRDGKANRLTLYGPC